MSGKLGEVESRIGTDRTLLPFDFARFEVAPGPIAPITTLPPE